jgi:hypothetical protein
MIVLEIVWLKTKHKIDFMKNNGEHGNFNECGSSYISIGVGSLMCNFEDNFFNNVLWSFFMY